MLDSKQEFPVEEERKYYVYGYCDPNKYGKYSYNGGKDTSEYEYFYIGYGTDGRIFDHLNEMQKFINKGMSNKEIFDLKGNRNKRFKIKKILESGQEPVIIKLKENLTLSEAKEEEIRMIWVVGRKDLKMGPLTNLTWGGVGGSGLFWSEERKIEYSKNNSGTNSYMFGKTGESHPTFGKKIYNDGIRDYRFVEGTQPSELEEGTLYAGDKHHFYNKEGFSANMNWFNDGNVEGLYFEGKQPIGWIKGKLSAQGDRNPMFGLKGENNPNNGKRAYNNGEIEIRCFPGGEPKGYILGIKLRNRKRQ